MYQLVKFTGRKGRNYYQTFNSIISIAEHGIAVVRIWSRDLMKDSEYSLKEKQTDDFNIVNLKVRAVIRLTQGSWALLLSWSIINYINVKIFSGVKSSQLFV